MTEANLPHGPISAILATLGRPKVLRLCLESLSKQTVRVSEVLVIHCGDDAETMTVTKDPHWNEVGLDVRYFHYPERNCAQQRNFGVERAKYDNLLLIDDDEEVDGLRPERTFVLDALRVGGTDARAVEAPSTTSGGPLIVALFADYLPYKRRTSLKPETIERVKRARERAAELQRDIIVLGLGDPRFARQLPFDVPTVVAWSGDRVMQQAAARAIQRTKKA